MHRVVASCICWRKKPSLGWTMLYSFPVSPPGTKPEPLTFRTAPEGPNYHLTAAKAGFRSEKRDNGGLGIHEAPVKFP